MNACHFFAVIHIMENTSATLEPFSGDYTSSNGGGPGYLLFDDFAVSVRCVVAIGAIIGNAVIIYALFCNRYSWQESHYFTLNVCIQDLLLSLLLLVNLSTRNVYVMTRAVGMLCLLKASLFQIFTTTEAWGIFLLALDRFIYITMPLRYYNIITTKFTLTLIAASWMTITLYSLINYFTFTMPIGTICLPLYYQSKAKVIVAFAIVFIIALMTLFFHCLVGITGFRQHKKSRVLPFRIQEQNHSLHNERMKEKYCDKPCPQAHESDNVDVVSQNKQSIQHDLDDTVVESQEKLSVQHNLDNNVNVESHEKLSLQHDSDNNADVTSPNILSIRHDSDSYVEVASQEKLPVKYDLGCSFNGATLSEYKAQMSVQVEIVEGTLEWSTPDSQLHLYPMYDTELSGSSQKTSLQDDAQPSTSLQLDSVESNSWFRAGSFRIHGGNIENEDILEMVSSAEVFQSIEDNSSGPFQDHQNCKNAMRNQINSQKIKTSKANTAGPMKKEARSSDVDGTVQMRITRMLLVVVAVFLISYFPSTLYTMVFTFIPSMYSDSLNFWLVTFLYINCLLNPLVYLLMYPAFRNTLRRSIRVGTMN